MKITESQLRRIIREEAGRLAEMPARRPTAGRIMTDEYGDQYYNLEPKDVFFGKAQTALDALVAELASIDKSMVRGLDAMDIHGALDDSGPYFGHGESPLHQAMHWLRRDDSPDGLANFFYEGLYRSRPAPRRLADQLMSHFAGERNQTKLEPGETAPSARALKFNSNLVAQRVGEALRVVKAVKAAALKASTMGAAAGGLLAEPTREEDAAGVSYSGPDIEIRSGRGSTVAGFGDGDAEGWAAELERLAQWCATKTTVEFQAANDLSATAYDAEGNEVGGETIVWMAGGRDMAREFSKMAKFFRRNAGNNIEVFSD